MGLSIGEANEALQSSIVLSKIAGMTSAEATESLIAAMRGYGLEVDNLMSIVDKLSAVDLESATSAKGLADSLSEVASVASEEGVSLDKMLGYIATVTEVTQGSAESVGNSLKTMLTRMQNVKLGAYLDEEGEAINDVEKVLSSYGIQLRDSTNEWRNMEDVLDEIGGKWDKFTSVQKSAIAVTIAGQRQQNKFIALMSNYSKAMDLANTATESSGSAMEKYGIYTESVEAKINAFKSSFSEMAQNTINSGLVKWVIDLGTGILNITDYIGGMIPTLITLISTIKTIKEIMDARKIAKELGTFKLGLGGIVSIIGTAVGAVSMLVGAMENARRRAEEARQEMIASAQKVQTELKDLQKSFLELQKTASDSKTQEEINKAWDTLYEKANKYGIAIDSANKSLEYFNELSRKTEMGAVQEEISANAWQYVKAKGLAEKGETLTSDGENVQEIIKNFETLLQKQTFLAESDAILTELEKTYSQIYSMSQTEAKKEAQARLDEMQNFIDETIKKYPQLESELKERYGYIIDFYKETINAIPESITNVTNAINSAISSEKAEYEKLKAEREEQFALEEKILNVQEKQKALAEAERKRVKIYRAGKGFVYEQDFAGISSARKELTSSKQELEDYKASMKFDKEKQELTDLNDAFEKLFLNDEKFKAFVNSIGLSADQLGDSFESMQNKLKEVFRQYLASIGVSSTEEYTKLFGTESDTTKSNIESGSQYFETHHNGGVIGASNSVYTGGKLKNDEIIAKLQKGETVLTKRGKNNLIRNLIKQDSGKGEVINVSNITLPNVSNAKQFIDELKSIGRMSIQKAKSYK